MNWLHEGAAIIATVDPQTVANSEQLSDEIDMSKWEQIMAVLLLGNMASETIDFGLQSASSSGGSYSNLSGKQATQLAAHASNNDGKQLVISLKSEELGQGNRYVKARAITGGATGGPACIIVLGVPRYGPGTDDDLSSVAEIIA